MSFYHILPSNTSPKTFPKNNASQYSTPITNPHMLEGKWEVALINLQYSNCINTFDGEKIHWSKKTSDITKATTPICKVLPPSKFNKRKDVINYYKDLINKEFQGILNLSIDTSKRNLNKVVHWKVLSKKHVVYLSVNLQQAFRLWSDVLTSYDMEASNYHHLPETMEIGESFIAVIPTSSALKKIIIKEENEEISVEEVFKRFNERVQYEGKPLAKIVPGQYAVLHRLSSDHVLVLSEDLHNDMQHRHAGTYTVKDSRYMAHKIEKTFRQRYYVSIFSPKCKTFNNELSEDIVLNPKIIFNTQHLITYLNDKFKNHEVSFSCNDANVISVSIGEAVTIEFDDVVRDILAFDYNKYTGRNTVTASDKISLTRRINFFYVYSNIGDFIRIGDTEAPLLAVIPYNPKACKLLSEVTFKVPMYVDINTDRISQIDIGIYDGAGRLIPFDNDAKTTLRLHFRQKS